MKPNFLNKIPAGAEAPKPCIVTTAPSKPTYYPPKSVPASTATRARIAFGRTASLYSADCCSNKSTQGILTTRTSISSFANSALASKAKDTSEPVAIMIASGVSLVESAIT